MSTRISGAQAITGPQLRKNTAALTPQAILIQRDVSSPMACTVSTAMSAAVANVPTTSTARPAAS
jgi:hypothetical protein